MTETATNTETNNNKDNNHVIHMEQDKNYDDHDTRKNTSCSCCFNNVNEAKGYNLLGIARGAVVMSNIFLASALIELGCDEVGALIVDPDDNSKTCDDSARVYGMNPSSLITNIAVISGLLSAFFMPIFGAVIDFSPHRKLTGIVSSLLLTMIQAIQIGTNQATWFPMAILQAIAGFVYQIIVVVAYSYLPEIARDVQEERMTIFSTIFTMSQFSSQLLFNVVVIVFAVIVWKLNTVQTAQLSQGISVLWCIVCFGLGWCFMPQRPAKHRLDKTNHSILSAGFIQNYKTAKAIWKQYKKGLKWYLLALIFAEASAAALTSISVVYLSDLGLSSSSIGIFFVIALVSTLPGSKFGQIITSYTNPNTSWKLCQLSLLAATIVGALALEHMKGPKELSYIWGAVIGFLLGWFYPTENLFFSMCLPQGQESELAGFFVYCTQILGWLPPLLFTILVQNNVSQKYGVIVTSFGFLVAVLFLSCTASWPEIIKEAEVNSNLHLTDILEKGGEEEETGNDDEGNGIFLGDKTTTVSKQCSDNGITG